MKTKIILIAILLIGFILRVWNIIGNPPSLYGDELTIVYDAYSLLKTGQDQTGNSFPLTFSMGAGRPAGYVYASIPFVALFGPSALGVRSLSILSGLGIILLLYYIGRKLFSDKIGLVAAFIATVSIWDISLSRGGFEAHFALFLALLGFYLFLKAKENPFLYFFSALSFGLTLHTYPTFKVSLLLFLPLLFWFQKTSIFKIGKKHILSFLVTLFILGGLVLSQTFIGSSEIRFASINVFSQDKLRSTIEEKINFERSTSQLPNSLAKYFHNKPIEYMKAIGENYLQNFSMDFLFIHGDRNPRHNMATMGGLYFIEIILIPLGLLSFWQKEKKALKFLLLWLLLVPIPTAIVDISHALRSAFMLPPLIIISTLGLITLLENRNRIHLASIVIIFLIQFIFFVQKLYFLAPNEYSKFWSYPAKMASKIALDNKSKFNYVILSDKIDNIEFAYPVYALVEPSQVINQYTQREELGKYNLKKFDNVYIGYIPDTEIEEFVNNLEGSVLFISSSEASKFLSNYETIDGLDKTAILSLRRRN